MKRNNLYLAMIGLGLIVATACNNNQKTEDHKDTVVVEKSTTQDSRTPAHNATTEPPTNVTVDKNGAEVTTGSTDVSVSKDSVAFKKR
jgi:hypothetical protein